MNQYDKCQIQKHQKSDSSNRRQKSDKLQKNQFQIRLTPKSLIHYNLLQIENTEKV